jgi:hypothetical protein
MAAVKSFGSVRSRIKARVKSAEHREIMAEKKILRDVKRIAGRTAQRAVALGIKERIGGVRRRMKVAGRISRRAAGAQRRGAAAVKRLERQEQRRETMYGSGY